VENFNKISSNNKRKEEGSMGKGWVGSPTAKDAGMKEDPPTPRTQKGQKTAKNEKEFRS